jgi:hypothetical protein
VSRAGYGDHEVIITRKHNEPVALQSIATVELSLQTLMKENHQQRILICGNYGASNLGDEAILAGLIVLVKSTFPGAKILAMSSDLSVTEKSHRVQAIRHFPAGFKSFFKYWLSFSGWKSLNEVRQCNLVLLGGGGLFADENPRAVWIWFVQFCWFWILRKKVVCIAQSVGPLNTKLGRIFTTFVFKRVEAISVRDRQSKVLLENLGINNIEVFADPAYAIGYQNEAALNRQRQVVLTLRPWVNGDHDNFNQIMADFIIWLREKHDLETVFLPFQTDHTDDRERYEQVKKILGRNSAGFKLIIPEDYSQGKTTLADENSKTTNIREGVVIRPVKESYLPNIGRLTLKFVSDDYLTDKKIQDNDSTDM